MTTSTQPTAGHRWLLIAGLVLLTIPTLACALASILGLFMAWMASPYFPFTVTPAGLAQAETGRHLFLVGFPSSIVLGWAIALLAMKLDDLA